MTYTVNRRKLIFIVLFSFVIIAVALAIVAGGATVERSDPAILFLFLLNIVVAFVGLIRSVKEYRYSFQLMFWLFGLFFFGVAPLLQYLSDTFAWKLRPSDSEILWANGIVLLWFVSYVLGQFAAEKYTIKQLPGLECNQTPYVAAMNGQVLICCQMVAIILTAYLVLRLGLSNLVYRETSGITTDSQMKNLIVNQSTRNFLAFNAVLHIIQAKQSRPTIGTAVAVLCMLTGCFPTGLSRYMMASLYCGLLIILFPGSRKKSWITWVILGGLILAFPAVDIFRYVSRTQQGNSMSYILNSIKNTYLAGDYDSYQSAISVRRWVEQDGFSYGKQFFGAILFFVPRALWPGKPYGTGYSAIKYTNQFYFTNVSASLAAEGYVNFSVFGVAVFAFLVGFLTRKVDAKYWTEQDELSTLHIMYPFSMLMFFFVLRGDLLSSWSYFATQLLFGILLCRATIIRKKIQKSSETGQNPISNR